MKMKKIDLADPHGGELLFFAGYILFLWRSVWITTMFPLSGLFTLVCVPLAALFIGLKILLYDEYPRNVFLMMGVALVCVCAVFYSSSSINPFFWLLMIAGSRKIKFEKILKVYLLINGSIVFLAFCASQLGVIENLQYETSNRGVRNAFGIIYPTDFGAHIFFMFLVYFYLKGERLRYYHYLITAGVAWLVYHFCNARLDSGNTLMLAILFAIGNGITGWRKVSRTAKNAWVNAWEKAGVWVMPLLAGVSVALTAVYQAGNGKMAELDKLVSSRLSLGKRGLEDYGIKLFGQPIVMNGFGGDTELTSNYFFLDCSYVYMLIRHGIVFLLLMLVIFAICCYRNRHDMYFLYALALVAINCMIAHHIIQIEYNPFALALLAECVREKEAGKNKSESLVLTKYSYY